jgi:hypothetical protein
MTQHKQAEFVKLNWDDTRSLRYTTEDSHIGITTVRNAVRSIQFTDMALDSISYLEDLKDRLADWSFSHKNKIEKAFLTLQDNIFLFLVVTKSNTFDDSFEDELSDLDISIASNSDPSILPLGLSVQTLPNCSEEQYHSFLNPRMTFECRIHNAGSG